MAEVQSKEQEIIGQLRVCSATELAASLAELAQKLMPGGGCEDTRNNTTLNRYLSGVILFGVDGDTPDLYGQYSESAIKCLKIICAKNSMASQRVLQRVSSRTITDPEESVRAQLLTQAIIGVCPAVIIPRDGAHGDPTPNALAVAASGMRDNNPSVREAAIKTAEACISARPETADWVCGKILLPALEDTDSNVRAKALGALRIAANSEYNLIDLVYALPKLDHIAAHDASEVCRTEATVTAAAIGEVHPNAYRMMRMETDNNPDVEDELG